MANTRFSTVQSNAMGPIFQGGVVTPVLINGNVAYTNKPALEQDAAFPMANILNPDRYLLWKTSNTPPSGADALKLDIDLGADRTIKIISFHGIRCQPVPEGLFPRPFTVHAAYRTAGQTYDGTATFTNFASAATASFGGYRDAMIEGAGETFRYLRIMFSDAATAPFALGRLFVSIVPEVDPGVIGSPGSTHEIVNPALVTENMAMGPVVTIIGETHDEFQLLLEAVSTATLAQLDFLRRARQSFVYYRHTGTVHECIVSGMRAISTQTFGPPPLYSVRLNLLSLA